MTVLERIFIASFVINLGFLRGIVCVGSCTHHHQRTADGITALPVLLNKFGVGLCGFVVGFRDVAGLIHDAGQHGAHGVHQLIGGGPGLFQVGCRVGAF